MPESLAPGILVQEIPGRETELDAFPEGVAAFVGETARGPVDHPLLLHSYQDFEQAFGAAGAETPLQRCVKDFFAAGGRKAAVVRVTNGARRCTLRLPGAEGPLVLEAVNPGRREWLRASVDYDGVDPQDTGCFNLVVQRLRVPHSERVADQEIYARVSVVPGADRYVADELLDSGLVRLGGAVPASRPAPTVSGAPGHPVTWIASAADGSDGAALTDYDLVGSLAGGTGLLALEALPRMDLLCLPPGPDGRRPGATLLLSALRYCRRRHAILLLEPPVDTSDAAGALAWLEGLNIAGENVAAFFPGLASAAGVPPRPVCGAIAGALVRDTTANAPVVGGGLRPALDVPPEERRRLLSAGINVVVRSAGGRLVVEGDRTLAPAEGGVPAFRSLAARRLALGVEETLLQGTRWALFEPPGPARTQGLRRQLEAWLESMRFAGRLAGDREEAWFVDLSALEVAGEETRKHVEFTLGFAPRRPGEFVILRVVHGLQGGRVVPVSAERWAMSRASLEDASPAG